MTDSIVLSTEIMAFSSGKGGTGKTSLIAALGYALSYCGHKVLMIDADRATDGLSLFILGPYGMNQLGDYKPLNTFSGIMEQFELSRTITAQPRLVHRLGPNDHDLSYQAIISGKGLYGDDSTLINEVPSEPWNRQFDRVTFQQGIHRLFDELRTQREYDYVLVDSRGGFSFESTDVAAAADSFVLVTEATNTNFYQDRNLVDRINAAAAQTQTRSLLRGIIVNKSTEPPEISYRQELVKEFKVRLEDTFPVALDLEAAAVYKTQKVIYREAPSSQFAYDSLQAFHQILKVVTSQWPEDRARRWNELINKVDSAIAKHNGEVEEEQKLAEARIAQFKALEDERTALQLEIASVKDAYEQEKRRQDILLEELRAQGRQREETWGRERAREQERLNETLTELSRARAEISSLGQQFVDRERRLTAEIYEARALEVKFVERTRLFFVVSIFLLVLLVVVGAYAIVQSQKTERMQMKPTARGASLHTVMADGSYALIKE